MRTPTLINADLASRAQCFIEARLLDLTDLHVVDTLADRAGVRDPEVLLGLAFVVRGPRTGHVGVALERLDQTVVRDERPSPATEVDADAGVAEDTATPQPLEWPEDLVAWRDRVVAVGAPLLTRTDGPAEVTDRTPFVFDGRLLYTHRYWDYQARLAAALRRRSRSTGAAQLAGAAVDMERLRQALTALFPNAGADGAPDWQQVAAALTALRPLVLLTGGPGTGKTTTVARTLGALLHQVQGSPRSLDIALAAPTGKAAVRMKESLGQALAALPSELLDERSRSAMKNLEASTLHRLLGFNPANPSRFRHGPARRLPQDVVIVDESSMVDLALMTKLIEAVRDDARLILVGDPDQLASVEAGSVLADLRASVRAADGYSPAVAQQLGSVVTGTLPTTTSTDAPLADGAAHLVKFHRYSGGAAGALPEAERPNPIADVAHALARGDVPLALSTLLSAAPQAGYAPFTHFSPSSAGSTAEARSRALTHAASQYLSLVHLATSQTPPTGDAERAHHRDVLRALDAFRVLCALRRGPYGVAGLNRAVADALAQATADAPASRRFDPRGDWYAGRPVIVTENSYVVGRMNGDVGVVVRRADGQLEAVFADGPDLAYLPRSRMPPHDTCFAMTVHKSQGSEFREALVVLPDPDQPPSPILTRELVYTALTRAKHRASFLATGNQLELTLSRTITRASGLQVLLSLPEPT